MLLHCDEAKNTNQTRNKEVQSEAGDPHLVRIRSRSEMNKGLKSNETERQRVWNSEVMTHTNRNKQITILLYKHLCHSLCRWFTVQQIGTDT